MAELKIIDSKKKWIQYDEDTEVLINYISKPELSVIQRKAEKLAVRTGADKNVISNQKLGLAAVEGWRKIGDHSHPGLIINKQPFPFSAENVVFLMNNSYEFSGFVNDNAIDTALFSQEDDAEDSAKEKKDSKNVL